MLRKILDEIRYGIKEVLPYLDEILYEDIIVKRITNTIYNDKYNNRLSVKYLDKWYDIKVEEYLIGYKVTIKPVNEEPILFNVNNHTIYTFYNGNENVFGLKSIVDKVLRVIRRLPEIKAQQEEDKLTDMEKTDVRLRKAKLLSSFLEQTYEMG